MLITRIVHSLLLLALAACTAGAAESAEPVSHQPSTETKPTETKPIEDLPNFHQVHDYLYRGGQPSAAGLEKLKQRGISTIIDLRNPGEKKFDEDRLAQKLGMKIIDMPMDCTAPTKKQVSTLYTAVDKAKEGKSGPVFVHCAHGSDRTGCLIGLWRVSKEGWSYDDAYKEMRKYYFTPKFVHLSEAVRSAANKGAPQDSSEARQ